MVYVKTYIIIFLGFVVPCIFNHSNRTPNLMQKLNVKFYCFVVQTLLNMFRALLCPSSGASQTAVAASGFRMNVEVDVFSAVIGHNNARNMLSSLGCSYRASSCAYYSEITNGCNSLFYVFISFFSSYLYPTCFGLS
jgi:hypothetical protein